MCIRCTSWSSWSFIAWVCPSLCQRLGLKWTWRKPRWTWACFWALGNHGKSKKVEKYPWSLGFVFLKNKLCPSHRVAQACSIRFLAGCIAGWTDHFRSQWVILCGCRQSDTVFILKRFCFRWAGSFSLLPGIFFLGQSYWPREWDEWMCFMMFMCFMCFYYQYLALIWFDTQNSLAMCVSYQANETSPARVDFFMWSFSWTIADPEVMESSLSPSDAAAPCCATPGLRHLHPKRWRG